MASVDGDAARRLPAGILTKTIVQSPVIRWILHARIRDTRLNDVVFVGDDFIQIKQVKRGGHLDHIATKSDFSAHIRAAKVFSYDNHPSDGISIKGESDGDLFGERRDSCDSLDTSQPQQFLVLTLSSDDLLFLYLTENDGHLHFVQQTLPMPTFDRILNQPGEHLAVDPYSRALAVAANEHEIILYSAKEKDHVQNELRSESADWCPVSAQRPLKVDGVIQHMEFLIPDTKDRDHIVLLLILIENRKTRALYIDWYQSTDLRQAQVHPSHSIGTARTVSTLLIPLIAAAFLVITGGQFNLYRNILSGPPVETVINPASIDALFPGSSPKQPLWTGWCRPRRTTSIRQEQDTFYLMREDGLICMLEIQPNGMAVMNNAGNAECHAGMAFASLGDDRDPDILAFMGDMSNGQVVSIGHWATAGHINGLSRRDTMHPQRVATLSNWASCTDLVVSSLPYSSGRSTRSRDTVLVTSGRQPYGTVTELRHGLEARLLAYLQLDGLHGTMGAWILPDVSSGSVLVLLSLPGATRIIHYDLVEELDELSSDAAPTFDFTQKTLVADILGNTHLIQVTETAVCVGSSFLASFEDRSNRHCPDGTQIVVAAIEPSLNLAFIVESRASRCSLVTFVHHAENGTAGEATLDEGLHQVGKAITLDGVVLCMATTLYQAMVIVVVVFADGTAQLLRLDSRVQSTTGLELLEVTEIPGAKEHACDHIAIIQSETIDEACVGKLLVLCGMRDGKICAIQMMMKDSCPRLGQSHTFDFGQSTVRLIRNSSDVSKAYATSGLDACLLSWNGERAQSLCITSVWVSDKARPQLSQGAVLAISKMPSSMHLSSTESSADLADSLVMISDEEIWIASVEPVITTVPRQIAVTGSPTRLIHAEQHRALVCASTCTSVRSFPSEMPHAKPEERRQIWPAIDFIPADQDEISFTFKMQPGERVYALLEWTMTKDDGKRYSFILVGGEYTSKSGATKGRITFLQPVVNRAWEVIDVREGRPTSFDHPVYALALYDPMTYIACVGSQVMVSTFSVEDSRWSAVGTPQLLGSPGTSITVDGELVHIATLSDALVTFRVLNTSAKPYTLVPEHQSPVVAHSLGHVVASLSTTNSEASSTSINILSTKSRQILGISIPATSQLTPKVLFSAALPISLTRVRRSATKPRWLSTAPGVLTDGLLGVATDGSLIGVSLIDKALWRRLFWLQRLCEWSEAISPLSFELETWGTTRVREVTVPVGLSPESQEEMQLPVAREQLLHINGDMLARVFQNGGAAALRAALVEIAGREDSVGHWISAHLESELAVVDAVVQELKVLLNAWL